MSWNDKFTTLKGQIRGLNAANPAATKGFGGLSKAVKEDGVVEFKTKEFVALGIAVATKCESCIMFHVNALIRIGATREEVADVLGMAIQMGGGPSLMYASKALDCFDEMSAK
ncbi:carboxymuconolactone decarboxylase family protein [Aliiroseovarius subalbicans]|uniref:carboxymuconolactone decarboxylase family protein n=1 Tax=Aliiroseovarius subalbicans TaxID=2925840 RepID=UPI001F5A7DC8|nr:carboxymuconolactone decarboxylase family protein [Aliiroseovarius subalbicans]MCI2399371.1 carboxymuconolactone decarboxylase family protein [Aliiroseovarius subalbicans]